MRAVSGKYLVHRIASFEGCRNGGKLPTIIKHLRPCLLTYLNNRLLKSLFPNAFLWYLSVLVKTTCGKTAKSKNRKWDAIIVLSEIIDNGVWQGLAFGPTLLFSFSKTARELPALALKVSYGTFCWRCIK